MELVIFINILLFLYATCIRQHNFHVQCLISLVQYFICLSALFLCLSFSFFFYFICWIIYDVISPRRMAMMRNLLAPYEQRPWAQTNWILVRLWRVRCIYFTVLHNSPSTIFIFSLPFLCSYYSIRFQLRIGALYQGHYAAYLHCFHLTFMKWAWQTSYSHLVV